MEMLCAFLFQSLSGRISSEQRTHPVSHFFFWGPLQSASLSVTDSLGRLRKTTMVQSKQYLKYASSGILIVPESRHSHHKPSE